MGWVYICVCVCVFMHVMCVYKSVYGYMCPVSSPHARLFLGEPAPSLLGRQTGLWALLPGPGVALDSHLSASPWCPQQLYCVWNWLTSFITCVSSHGSGFALLCHSSPKNLQCPHIRMKSRFLSSKGLLWVSFCPLLTIALERHFAVDKLNDILPCWARLCLMPLCFFLCFPLHLWMPSFLHLSNFYFPFNTLSDITPLGKLPQHPSLMERALHLQDGHPVSH